MYNHNKAQQSKNQRFVSNGSLNFGDYPQENVAI